MREVGVVEAEGRLGQLLDRVEAGEEIVITRSGRAVARLLPPTPAFDTVRAQEAAAAIRRMSQGATLGGSSIRELMNEGRP